MHKNNTLYILGYNINNSLENIDFDKRSLLINTINPHSYCVAKEDLNFQESLKKSDMLLPDGIGIVLAAKILNKEKIYRIAGSDLHLHLLNIANIKRLKVFYLGSMNSTLEKIRDRISKEYPNIQFESYSPPYKSEFSDNDNSMMIEAINNFKPNILFIGMTAPKQEKWAYQHKDLLNVNIIASIGAVFDFYAGTVKRPSKFWISLGLEWLVRLLGEPKRLWKRNFVSTPLFAIDVLKQKFKLLLEK